jgi:hypothetical protein
LDAVIDTNINQCDGSTPFPTMNGSLVCRSSTLYATSV